MLRQALFVAVKDLRYLLRDRRQLVWLLIMPPVFMYFIGTSTAGMGMGGGAGATPLAVYGTEEAGFVGAYLQKRLVEYGFELTFFDSAEVFAQQRRRLTLPAGLSDSLLSGGRVKLDLKHRDAGIDRDYDVFRVQRAAYATLAAVAASAQGGAVTAAELTQIETQPRALSLRVEKAGQRRHIPSGFEQAIPGILVMFVLMNMLNSGAILLVSERERGLLRRLAYAPIPRGAVVLGKWGGRMALGAVQVALGAVLWHRFLCYELGAALANGRRCAHDMGFFLRLVRFALGQPWPHPRAGGRSGDFGDDVLGGARWLLVADRDYARVDAAFAKGVALGVGDGCDASPDQLWPWVGERRISYRRALSGCAGCGSLGRAPFSLPMTGAV